MKNNIDPFLTGNYAPVQDELEVVNLKIRGEIPADLCGAYMRNGPNPAYHPISYTYPFDGDGMIHAIYIADGKAHYRNRFVQTKELMAERRAGKAIYGGIMHPMPPDPKYIDPDGNFGPIKNGAFIHIIRHANQYLAMYETAEAYVVDEKLRTLSQWCPGTQTPIKLGAHTRLDPVTGDLWAINYDLEPPYLTIYRIDHQGKLQQKINIEKPYCSMIHDFVITENYVIFFDCPAILDIQKIMSGGDVISWQPECGVRIGVMSRKNSNMVWFDTESFFVFHFANAYEFHDEIIIDYIRHSHLKFVDLSQTGSKPHLARTKLNMKNKTISHQQIDDRIVEFPRTRENKNFLAHRYIYTPTLIGHGHEEFNSIIKYDMLNQTNQIFNFGEFTEIGEAIFVDKGENSQAEDDGYLMVFVYSKKTNQSELAILDAQQLKILAQIECPRRVPHGLHGSWMTDCFF